MMTTPHVRAVLLNQRQEVMRAVAATIAWRAVRDDRRDADSGEYVSNMCSTAHLVLLAGLPTLGGAALSCSLFNTGFNTGKHRSIVYMGPTRSLIRV